MTNKYTHSFISKCPNNNDFIYYTLTIKTKKMIMVEVIEKECKKYTKGYHEHIADELYKKFKGKQALTATHNRVTIKTIRK